MSAPPHCDSLPATLAEAARRLPSVVHDCLDNENTLTLGERRYTYSSASVKLQESARLYQAVRRLRPSVSAEVGLFQGVSAMAILQALEDNGTGEHHVIDPYQIALWKGCGVENVRQAGLAHRFHFYEKFVEEVAPGLPRIQFGFIDGSHLPDLTIIDFALFDKRLDIGGVLGFHDMWMPSLQKVLRFILTNRPYTAWREAEPAPGRSKIKRALKNAAAPILKAAAAIPGMESILSPRLLKPIWMFGLEGNMVFVRKEAEDQRDYKDYAEF